MDKYIDAHGSDEPLMNSYKDFCFANYSEVLADSLGKEAFQKEWSTKVAGAFNIPMPEVYASYTADDKYHTDDRMRTMWKYGAAKGVFGTPTAFVNGSKLDSVPQTVADWTTLMDQVYDSQYHAPKAMHMNWLM